MPDGLRAEAREAADDPGIADLLADALHLLFEDVAGGPVGFDLGAVEQEVCYGFQAMANALGGTVDKTGLREYGSTETTILGEGRSVLEGMPQHQKTWMSHGDSVHRAPEGFEVLATTAGAEVAAFANEAKGLFGVQWHPEVKHSAYGQQVLELLAAGTIENMRDIRRSAGLIHEPITQ